MNHTQVAIIGGGMAGATAAAMLGQRGVDTVVLDPKSPGMSDFRCEKVEREQYARLERCGLLQVLQTASTPSRSLWVGRGGRVVERVPNELVSAPYGGMVGAMQGAIGGSAQLVRAKVASVATSEAHQVVTLRDGTQWRARLVVLATGPSARLARHLGFERTVLSAQHSVSLGFNLVSEASTGFPFECVTWYPERFDAATAYLTVFAMADHHRANLFVYRPMRDAWFGAVRADPVAAVTALMPGFRKLSGPFSIPGGIRIRPVDLYQTTCVDRAGLVLLGDAFASSDPAAGNGLDKVWNDVYVLVDRYIPQWLDTPGMGTQKIRSFYADADKQACDRWCRERAFRSRSMAQSRTPRWHLHRRAAWAAQLVRGAVRLTA